MAGDTEHEITRVLHGLKGREPRAAAEDLLPLVYDQLRVLARGRLAREPHVRTLQPTALVHEAYLRVLGEEDPGWNSRGHFFAAASLAMRRILVEQARRRARVKRGGGLERVGLTDAEPAIEPPHADVLAVDTALRRLEAEDPRKGQIVNLRFFAGLTVEETARAMELSVGTIEREWRFIKSWLKLEIGGEPDG